VKNKANNNIEGGNMRYFVALLAILITIGAVGVQAQMPCKMMNMGDELKLTDAQQKQMQTSIVAEKKEMIQLRADLAKAKLELQEIMMADNVDKAAALKKDEQVSAVKATIAKKRLAAQIDRMSILTSEQRQKCPRMPMMMGEGRGRGKGCGDDMGTGMGGPGMGRCQKQCEQKGMHDKDEEEGDKE
jgi:Spy/CpxP family protein refolding chaperone